MPTITRLTPADARRMPWKNGRGVTEEVAIGPAGAAFEADTYRWRVSRAAVVESGPFSTLPGIDRVLVVTDGVGLRVTHDAGAATTVPPLAPHRFRGDDVTVAALVDGPVRDWNLFTRRGLARADVVVLVGPRPSATVALPAGDALVHVLTGEAAVSLRGVAGAAASRAALAAGEGLLVRDVASRAACDVAVGAGAVVLVATVEAIGPAGGDVRA